MGKRCAVCGEAWDECNGECQEWITPKEKAEYLRLKEYKRIMDKGIEEILEKYKKEDV